MKEEKDDIFHISIKDWNKIIHYAQSAYTQLKAEIGGQLTVIEEDGQFKLIEPVILKQEVSNGTCDLDATELAIYYDKLYKKYGNKVRHCWWHSHHTMQAFWSGTDVDTILSQKTNDFSLSLVVNLNREYKLRVQYFKPIELDKDVKLNIIGQEVPESINKEVIELCNKPERTVVTTYGYNGKQSNLWAAQQNKEVDHYNKSYGIGSYNSFYDDEEEVDVSLVPDSEIDKLYEYITKVIDKVPNNISKKQCKEINRMFSELNKGIKKYNLEIPEFTRGELSSWKHEIYVAPEDVLENIQPVVQATLQTSNVRKDHYGN